MRPLRVIISGGGTGGHIFPAVAIARALKKKDAATEILFVGAKGKMEMEKVPEQGFEIIGLDIMGLQRKLSPRNLLVPFKLISSVLEARNIVRKFKPDVAIGVGGYASAPLLYAAQLMKVPTLIQEQNSYAGLANKWLGKNAKKICVAFSGMEKYFPSERIVVTGNPVREELLNAKVSKEEGLKFFNLSPGKSTILVIGGSLGARTINESIATGLNQIITSGAQLIWQTGKWYYEQAAQRSSGTVSVHQFIKRMDLAYAAADIVISRAGALSIAELCVMRKAVILVPSPNVTEDHQTKNAMALVNEDAAILVKDAGAREKLVTEALTLMGNTDRIEELKRNISQMAKSHAADSIVEQIYSIVK